MCDIIPLQKGDKKRLPKAKKEPFDQVAYNREYNKENYTRVSVVLNKRQDSDIIAHLEDKPSKSDYIKRLIREDMKHKPGE